MQKAITSCSDGEVKPNSAAPNDGKARAGVHAENAGVRQRVTGEGFADRGTVQTPTRRRTAVLAKVRGRRASGNDSISAGGCQTSGINDDGRGSGFAPTSRLSAIARINSSNKTGTATKAHRR